MNKAGRSPSMGAPGAGSDRWAIARPPAEREALNLVLDVLAQNLRYTKAEPHSPKFIFGRRKRICIFAEI